MADWKKLIDSARQRLEQGAKAAEDGLRSAGDDLRRAADQAGKVVGIGVGEIAISITERAPRGHPLRGTLRLQLTEPIAARRLTIALRARRTRIPVENVLTRGSTIPEVLDVFDHSVELSGEQTYESGTLSFAIDVPDQDPDVEVPGLLGDALKAARALKSMTESELRWRLVARLEIPWRLDLQTEVEIVVHGPRPAAEPPPTSAPPPRSTPPEPAIPRAITLPSGWTEGLRACLTELQRRGDVIVHRLERGPVDPQAAMEIIRRHPDLDPEILQWYGVMDGLELIVGTPLDPAASCASIAAAQRVAARYGGAIGCLGEVYSFGELGDALVADFGTRPHAVRVLEIPPLATLLDGGTAFADRDGDPAVWGMITVAYGDYFGLVRGEEIRSWRQPVRGDPGRDGCYDHYADAYQAALTRREREHAGRWWVVRGDDHGAGLVEPALVLRFAEMLAVCLDHLRVAPPPAVASTSGYRGQGSPMSNSDGTQT